MIVHTAWSPSPSDRRRQHKRSSLNAYRSFSRPQCALLRCFKARRRFGRTHPEWVGHGNEFSRYDLHLVAEAPLHVQERTSGNVVATADNPLQPGEYDVYCDGRCSLSGSFNRLLTLKTGRIEVNNKPWVHRLIWHTVSGREDAFRDGIRARDGKCVISGVVNRAAFLGDWTHFEVVHIFPLEKENLWLGWNYGQWVTDMDGTYGVSKINSCQNGFLLRRDIHSALVSTCCRRIRV